MRRNFTVEDVRKLHDRACAGESLCELAKEVRSKTTTLKNHFRWNGLGPIQKKEIWNKRNDLPEDLVCSRYEAGESEMALAQEFRVARLVIERILKEHGVQRRNGSQANFLRMGRMSADERKQLTQASHEALRGKLRPREWGVSLSHANYKGQTRKGVGEVELHEALIRAGELDTVGQAPFEIYNIDILCGPVAVEIFTESGHWDKRPKVATKLKKILETKSLLVVFVSLHRKGYGLPCFHAKLNDLVALVQEMRRNHDAVGPQYRVIRCTTERFTRFHREDGSFAAVPVPEKHLHRDVTQDFLLP